MKKIKFNKSKFMLVGGLVLATATVLGVTLSVVTSCSSSSTPTSTTNKLEHSYAPSAELAPYISEQQYNDIYDLFLTFDGNNKLYIATGQDANLNLRMKNIKMNSFSVSGNTMFISAQFDMVKDDGTNNNWGFCEGTESYVLNPGNNVDKLFTLDQTSRINHVDNPDGTYVRPISQSVFEQKITSSSMQSFQQMIASGLIKWEN